MKRNYWGFSDVKELEKDIQDMPDAILNEQFSLISEKTDYILYGKANTIQLRKQQVEYIKFALATLFSIIVPKLDDYSKTILIMYSNPENEYPVAITIGKSYDEDMEEFTPQYTCKDKEQFESAIKETLSSPKVTQIVKLLYSKAYMISTQKDDFE